MSDPLGYRDVGELEWITLVGDAFGVEGIDRGRCVAQNESVGGKRKQTQDQREQ
ncbi:hypothetical protein ACGFIE_12475 [Micromonospora sp. NPDC049275]|uniref:hypothetical protein n=1 Tax=Micromonospora sp. NPDC049275 TaxID=3364268 RepID=UPI003717531A